MSLLNAQLGEEYIIRDIRTEDEELNSSWNSSMRLN